MKNNKYLISEIFYSLQGEGSFTGTAMIFVRFHGCNLNCEWCDTKYSLQGPLTQMTIEEIIQEVQDLSGDNYRVCLTGGEPFFNRDLAPLIVSLQDLGYIIHAESNGTIYTEDMKLIDHLTISPKKQSKVDERSLKVADEVKVVLELDDLAYPLQFDTKDTTLADLYVQPEGNKSETIQSAIKFVKENPLWKLSLQTHKMISIR